LTTAVPLASENPTYTLHANQISILNKALELD